MNESIKNIQRIQALTLILLAIILIAGIVFYVFAFPFGRGDTAQSERGKYVLYIGTDDKDTGLPELSLDDCKKLVERACLSRVGGCTICEANGAWRSDEGKIFRENTLVCSLDDVTYDEAQAISDELLAALNQSSILIERQSVDATFYTGTTK